MGTDTIKNYGIFLRYDSRSGTHNMYKEFRDVSLNGAINQLYTDMAGRHRARKRSVYVIKAEQVRPKECKRTSTKAFHKDDLKFPSAPPCSTANAQTLQEPVFGLAPGHAPRLTLMLSHACGSITHACGSIIQMSCLSEPKPARVRRLRRTTGRVGGAVPV